LHQHQVASDIERRRIPSKAHRVLESVPVRHECRGSENAISVCVNDSGIHLPRKAEIVGVDDEALQNLSRTKFWGTPNASSSRA
jgi:hypothetical protein